jgi:serine protease Do
MRIPTNGQRRQPGLFLLVPFAVALGLILATRAGAEDEAIVQANRLSEAFRAAAAKVLPTVVRINTVTGPETNVGGPGQVNPFRGTPFEDFFDDQTPGFRFHGGAPQRMGVGSGIVIDSTGVILTNNHVVEDAAPSQLTVELADGQRFQATEIKRDERSDLAIVRIKPAKPLPAARFGDSGKMAIGDWVIAVGSPFELDQTVSAGIISALGRTLDANRPEYLQTDAAINPGNSGGPLVNLRGEVIGINTAIASRNGGYQGIGFAVPSNQAQWVAGQLVARGKVDRAYLGVTITKIDAEVAEQFGVAPQAGVVVTEVFAGTPAANAGLKEGDLIMSFAGQTVTGPSQLQQIVERCPLHSTQTLQIRRDKKPMALTVTLTPMPEDVRVGSSGPAGGAPRGFYASRELGITVGSLTPELAEQLNCKGFQGVVVTAVDPGSLAARVGLVEGTLIMRVGRTKVTSVEEFKASIEKTSLRQGVLLLVRVGGGNRFIVLKAQ